MTDRLTDDATSNATYRHQIDLFIYLRCVSDFLFGQASNQLWYLWAQLSRWFEPTVRLPFPLPPTRHRRPIFTESPWTGLDFQKPTTWSRHTPPHALKIDPLQWWRWEKAKHPPRLKSFVAPCLGRVWLMWWKIFHNKITVGEETWITKQNLFAKFFHR